jgi:hypothetical protein
MLEISEAGSAWPSTAAPDRGTARRYHLDALMELGPEFALGNSTRVSLIAVARPGPSLV